MSLSLNGEPVEIVRGKWDRGVESRVSDGVAPPEPREAEPAAEPRAVMVIAEPREVIAETEAMAGTGAECCSYR